MSNDTKRRRIGSVRQLPNGRWLARISRGTKADGGRRNPSKVCDTKAEAESWLQAMAVKLDERPDLGAGVTLSQLWSVYRKDRDGKLANSTLTRYAGCFERHWLPAIGTMDVSTIDVATAQRVIDTVRGRRDAMQCKAALSSVFTWAVRLGIMTANPIRTASLTYPGDTISAWEDESVWDDDPFGAIERTRNTWGAATVMDALPLMEGLPLEPVWLAMVGSGARLEEAFAIRRMDVRRAVVDGTEVTQLALHHALNASDGRHRTKNRKSARIVAMMEPFGERYWQLACEVSERDGLVCSASPHNYGTRWRGYFAEPSTSKHTRAVGVYKGRLHGLPYIPLSRMRATHETLMQEAGVLDSVNAAMHGHSERISYRHYQQADSAKAAQQASSYLSLVG